MKDDFKLIASRIRELREICGYTPETISAELSIDVNLYRSYEEKGEDIPISVLYHLANLFHVDLNELLSGQSPHLETYCYVKKGTGLAIDRYPGYSFASLAYSYKHKIMEPLLVTVEAGDKTPALVTHSGQEFNLCLEGTIEVLFGEKVITLNTGDSIYFNPLYPHGQRAVGKQAKFLTVISE